MLFRAARSAPRAPWGSRCCATTTTPRSGSARSTGALGLVDLDTPVELVTGSLAGMRIFAGYAGWGADQLEAEIEEGSWYVVPGEAPDVFRDDPADLWRDVLRRQPGELAWHSTPDPES